VDSEPVGVGGFSKKVIHDQLISITAINVVTIIGNPENTNAGSIRPGNLKGKTHVH